MPESPQRKKRPWIQERKPHQRLVDHSKIYNSWKWRMFSKRFKDKNPTCAECLMDDIMTPSTTTDHIKRIKDGGAIYDERNCQALCDHHHAVKSGSEAHINRIKKTK